MDLFLVKILRGAVFEVVTRWRPLLRALVLPAVLMTASSYATQYLMQWQYTTTGSIESLKVIGYLQLVVWLVLYVLFGMSCHRIILLGEVSLPSRFGIYWTMRETRFLGWAILVGLIHTALTLPFHLLAMYLPPFWRDWSITWYISVFLATYFDGRISLVLPATAIDERSSIVESWRLTRGNGLAIAIALFVVALATDLVSVGTQSVFASTPDLARVISKLLQFPLVAVAVGVLSVTYRELRQGGVES